MFTYGIKDYSFFMQAFCPRTVKVRKPSYFFKRQGFAVALHLRKPNTLLSNHYFVLPRLLGFGYAKTIVIDIR